MDWFHVIYEWGIYHTRRDECCRSMAEAEAFIERKEAEQEPGEIFHIIDIIKTQTQPT